MDVRIICAADLHLGRRPTRLPEAWAGGRISSAVAWGHLVDRAVTDAVDVVLLAGDVVDRFNRSFEAWGPLESGVGRLKDAGIPVVAVAGNHDFDTLADIADEVGHDNLFVLGRGGRWERWTLADDDGRPRLHVDGWSFPRKHWTSDPTEGYEPAPSDDAPLVGLLHCDLDQPESPYGPVAGSTLRGRGADAWILGHVHNPGLHESPGGAPLLYPGSLQALDPGEGGMHGAWTVTVEGGRTPSFERIPLSGAHYATLDVDVEGVEDAGALSARVRGALTDHLADLAEADGGMLRVARCRVRLTGRTALHDRLTTALDGLEDFDPAVSADIRLSVDPSPVVDTRPALDLDDLAKGSDAAAHLARLLRALEGGGAPDRELLESAAAEATSVATRGHFVEAGLPPLETGPDSEVVRSALRRQAGRLLDALVAGREDG